MRTLSIAGVLAALGCGLLSLALALWPTALDALDAGVQSAVAPYQSLLVTQVFLVITTLGGGMGIILVAVAFAYFLRLRTVHLFRLAFLLGAVRVANRLLKGLFERMRPDVLEWLEPVSSFAFPSAHASSAMALYGFVAVVLYRRTGHWLAILIPTLVILLVGLSRVMLSVHHFSDVVGGYLLGFALLAFSFALPFERWLKRYG